MKKQLTKTSAIIAISAVLSMTSLFSSTEVRAMAEEAVCCETETDENLEVLAHLICGETQNCSDEEQLYVGSVVLNRVAHSNYPDTIKEVVFQKGQYACTWDGNYDRTPTERNWANAAYLLDNGSVLPEDVIYQAGFKQGSEVYIHTKHHYYCRE